MDEMEIDDSNLSDDSIDFEMIDVNEDDLFNLKVMECAFQIPSKIRQIYKIWGQYGQYGQYGY